MSLLSDLVATVLIEINDPSQVTYTTPELVRYLNYGNRVLRRTIFEIRPRLLMEPQLTGTLSGDTIIFPKNIMRIVEVRFNHRQIFEVVSEQRHGHDDTLLDYALHERGHDEYGFILMGFNQIKITPHPKFPYPYEIQYIAGLDENLSATDDSGLSLELEDMLVEFAVMRAGMRNGADMSGETSILELFKTQIEETLEGLGGARRSVVCGYQRGNEWRRRYY